ncbi:SLOG family protein [Streptomyces sp. NPDC059474]|uniref:SLOG family protein n=1 Tax=Streptomyces sp. NPDC059474 TaxID=3346846 RepID=UPI0036CCEB9E
MTNSHSRVLICGSRRWPWPDTITTPLDRAAARHGNDLVVIEGAGTGAASAAHHWCTHHDLPAWRHRCHPLTPPPPAAAPAPAAGAKPNATSAYSTTKAPAWSSPSTKTSTPPTPAAPTRCAAAPSPSASPSGSCPPLIPTKACGCTSATTTAATHPLPHADPTNPSPPRPPHPQPPRPTSPEQGWSRVPQHHRPHLDPARRLRAAQIPLDAAIDRTLCPDPARTGSATRVEPPLSPLTSREEASCDRPARAVARRPYRRSRRPPCLRHLRPPHRAPPDRRR